jgi:2-polyprenyl-6-methoxyphenol hydroxylase-like FAD-dependent oxidoreductase
MPLATSLTGQAAVVVGGSSGIGLATAQLLVNRGAIVTIVGRTEERLAKAKGELGGAVSTAVMDCADEAAAAASSKSFPHSTIWLYRWRAVPRLARLPKCPFRVYEIPLMENSGLT